MPLTDIIAIALTILGFAFIVGSVWRYITGEMEYRNAIRPTQNQNPPLT